MIAYNISQGPIAIRAQHKKFTEAEFWCPSHHSIKHVLLSPEWKKEKKEKKHSTTELRKGGRSALKQNYYSSRDVRFLGRG